MKPPTRSMPMAPPVMPEYPALPLTLTVIEMEVDVDRARLIDADEPGGDALPAVVVRMPAYVAGALAKVLDTWAIVCQAAGSDDTTEWVSAAHALLLAGREAADGIPYPELSDLRHAIPDTLAGYPADGAVAAPVAPLLPPVLPVPPVPPVPAIPSPPSAAGMPAEPAASVGRADDHRVTGRPLGQRAPAAVEPPAAGRRGDGRRSRQGPRGRARDGHGQRAAPGRQRRRRSPRQWAHRPARRRRRREKPRRRHARRRASFR